MTGLIYIVWISIPIVLVLLGVLVAIRQSFQDPADVDLRRPRRIFRKANAFALYAALCVGIDMLVLGRASYWLPNWYIPDEQILLARLALLPALAFLGFFVVLIVRMGRPRRGFDRLQMEVRGSNPLFLILPLAILGFFFVQNPPDQQASHPREQPSSSGQTRRDQARLQREAHDSQPQQAHSNAAPALVTQITNALQGTFLEGTMISDLAVDLGRTIHGWLGLDEIGFDQTVDHTQSQSATVARPEFNPEGNLRFGPLAEGISLEEGVDPLLVGAIIEVASGFNTRFQSSQGHIGLMGLRADVMSSLGNRDFFNPHQNIRFGCRELKRSLELHPDDLGKALAWFRRGEHASELDSSSAEGQLLSDFVAQVKLTYAAARERPGR